MTAPVEAMPAVRATVNRRSHVQIVLDCPDGAPDTRDPAANGITVRPQYALISAWPDDQVWKCSYVMVVGPKVKTTGTRVTVTKRSYDVMLMEPMDAVLPDDGSPLAEGEWDGRAPDWLRPLIAAQLDRLNGVPTAAVQRIVDEAIRIYRFRDKQLNDPAAHGVLVHTNGAVAGLRIALCLLMGWDVQQESDKEGAADELIVKRWMEQHPEEWTA